MNIEVEDIINVLYVLLNSNMLTSFEKIYLIKNIDILKKLDKLYNDISEQLKEPI